MAITGTIQQNAKELLLYIAIVLAATGAELIRTDVKLGVALLVLSFVTVFGRGLYKKFLDNEEKSTDKELPTA